VKELWLETDRLIIREWQPAQDAAAAAAIAIYGDPRVTRWLGDNSLDATRQAVQARLTRYRDRAAAFPGLGCWAVTRRKTAGLVGNLLLMPLPDRDNAPSGDIEIGWHFCPASWGHGYATEAAHAVMTYGFSTLALPALYVVTLPDNHRSMRVMQRLGMQDFGFSEAYYGGHRLRLFGKIASNDWSGSQYGE